MWYIQGLFNRAIDYGQWLFTEVILESVFVMLEAIRERSKGWLAKLLLAFITIPFALWGIDSYLHQAGSNVAVAKVDSDSITVQQFGTALQNFRNQLQAEGKVDAALLDSPVIKESVLNRLINTRLINKEITDSKFMISDEYLGKYIVGMQEFQKDGKFSQELYDGILSQNRMTASQFEASMRGDLLVAQAKDGLAALAYAPQAVIDQALKTEGQVREVSVAELKTADFINQIKIDDAQIKDYYEKHKDKFIVPEQVKLEFVLMSANTLIAGMQVSDDEINKYYSENAAKFQGDEQRHASHILIGFGVSATPQAKLEAKKKAEDVLAEVKKHPADFSKLASKYSMDPGSAAKGGDLGSFGRGMMVKPFEDAVFSMKPGEISDLVESEFGYHIIKLNEVTGMAQSFDSVKPQIKAELLYQKAIAKFSEQADNFNNMVYEQSDSLKPAADAFGLQVQSSGWMSRADGDKYFKTSKVMDKVFTDEVLKDKRNTEAIEISPNNLMSARVVDYKAATPRAFDEVRPAIESFLKMEQAAKLAQKKGEEYLAALRKGSEVSSLEWIPSVTVDRKNAQGLTDLTMRHVFKMDANKLPSYTGVADDNKGYLLIKVIAVTDKQYEDAEKAPLVSEYQSALANEYLSAYIKSLKAKAKITVNRQLLSDSSTR